MNTPSPEKLKSAVQALHRVRAVEGPPGDNGQRSVWHMCPEGAELLTLVDMEGRLQRQEFTLLEDHYVWTSGEGLKTGRVESGAKANPAAAIVHTDAQLVPPRLLRAALALETYGGEDRYILHMKRVLALAREGLELRDSSEEAPPDASPLLAVAVTAGGVKPSGSERVPNEPQSSSREGLFMMVVLGLGLILGVALFIWLL